MSKIGVVTILKEVKVIHPTDIALVKTGGFYRVYGKDAYIISNLFQYKIKKEDKIASCGFPLKSINRVIATLEKKKINYIVLDSRDNYSVNEKMDFKNLNKYNKEFEKAKTYVGNQIRIDKIHEYLVENSQKEELKNILKRIESVIYAKGKI